MEEYLKKKDKKPFTRDAIIGLGEDSFKKSYYPELQEKIMRLEQINARNEALISTIPDILLVSDDFGKISPFSPIAKKLDPPMIKLLSEPQMMGFLREAVKEAVRSGSFAAKEFQVVKEGQTYYYEIRLHRAEINEILIMIRNMTERIALERQLIELVERDSLTKLYNRRSFEEKMSSCNGGHQEKIALVTFDVNGLKFINDTLGHLAGDEIIIAAGDAIFRVFGGHGQVARIGGDEFGVIMENVEENQVESMILKLNALVVQNNAHGISGGLSLSYGYSYHKSGTVKMELMFQEADNNMYQNKLLNKESVRSTFVNTFMKAMEAKDYIVEGHVSRMEELSQKLGEALSLHHDRLVRLVLLTKFHDIGKIGIPDSILKKPAPLLESEWKVMRTHSTIGERIALEAVELKEIAHLILKHHERWDGRGYPLGLKGEEIPVECRILAITDAYDAMTNDRPYRAAMMPDLAVAEIERCGGTQFDPQMVTVFSGIMKQIIHKNK